jgi:hypothetical protein
VFVLGEEETEFRVGILMERHTSVEKVNAKALLPLLRENRLPLVMNEFQPSEQAHCVLLNG